MSPEKKEKKREEKHTEARGSREVRPSIRGEERAWAERAPDISAWVTANSSAVNDLINFAAPSGGGPDSRGYRRRIGFPAEIE